MVTKISIPLPPSLCPSPCSAQAGSNILLLLVRLLPFPCFVTARAGACKLMLQALLCVVRATTPVCWLLSLLSLTQILLHLLFYIIVFPLKYQQQVCLKKGKSFTHGVEVMLYKVKCEIEKVTQTPAMVLLTLPISEPDPRLRMYVSRKARARSFRCCRTDFFLAL